jgi:hypothetical protein
MRLDGSNSEAEVGEATCQRCSGIQHEWLIDIVNEAGIDIFNALVREGCKRTGNLEP